MTVFRENHLYSLTFQVQDMFEECILACTINRWTPVTCTQWRYPERYGARGVPLFQKRYANISTRCSAVRAHAAAVKIKYLHQLSAEDSCALLAQRTSPQPTARSVVFLSVQCSSPASSVPALGLRLQ